MTANDADDNTLREWGHRLAQALQILDLKVEPAKIIDLADCTSSSVAPNAGLISVFLAGYAAGTASTTGRKSADDAVDAAFETVNRLSAEGASSGPDRDGWTASGQ